MNRLGRCALLLALTAALGGACGHPSAPTAAPAAPVSHTAVPTPDAQAPATAATGSWVMPNLVGVNLQDAQDRIQALTANAIFFTTSHDATGAGRQQILDRDWKVCDQNVAPGRRITADTKIDFGAVKLNESC